MPQVIKPKHLSQLVQPSTWRGIPFPFTHLRTNMEQRLVVHEYTDKDSAHVESTGRKPLIIAATVVFNNFIKPFSSEKWVAGDLYPNQYYKFFDACKDSSPGVLTHPDLGDITVKCQSIAATMDGGVLGGVVAEVVWIETINVEAKSDNAADRLHTETQEMMNELDTAIHRGFEPPPDFEMDIFSAIDQIGEFIESVNWIGKRLLNQINKVLFHVNKLLTAINRFDKSTIGGLKMKTLQLRASLEALLQQLNGKAGKIRRYKVPKDTNLANLVRILKNDARDLIKLNPTAGSRLVIRANTVILYFAVA